MNKFVVNFLINLLVIAVANAELSCIICSSNENPFCATDPSQIKYEKCTEEHPKCFTRIESGVTIRGCVENTPEELDKINCNGKENENGEMTCELCQEDFNGCNTEIYPSHRIECLQCDGPLSGDCFSNSDAEGKSCPLYVSGDKCFIWKSETEKKFKRGCLSDEATGTGLCKDKSKCYICHGNSCNFLPGNNTEIPNNGASHLSGFSVLTFVATFYVIYRH